MAQQGVAGVSGRGWDLRGRAGRFVLESLEARAMLSETPLPSLGVLESQTHPVIRFSTTAGDVDIELFNDTTPNTVANFLNYVTSQRLDETVFHRAVSTAGSGIGIVQGGGFLYKNATGLSTVQSDAPINYETTSRTNVAQTIAMARTNNVNSATSQFFFNTVDNSSALTNDPNNNGYVVFGRVVQGWSNVLTIYNANNVDLSADPGLAGPDADNFQTTPVTPNYTQLGGVRENALYYILNAEVIKPAGNNNFYTHSVVFPEGNRTATSTETVQLYNPNSTSAIYDVLVRYERGNRDSIVTSGTLNATTSLNFPVSIAGQASPDNVRQNTPYAIVVRTSTPIGAPKDLAVTAVVTRSDFNASTSESAVDPSAYSSSQLRSWNFPRVEHNSTFSREFITWANLDSQDGSVTVTFSSGSGPNQAFTYSLAAWRRGGVQAYSLGIADGTYSVRVTSTVDIVAMLSDFDIPVAGTAANQAYTPGWAVVGAPGTGQVNGIVPGISINTAFTQILSIDNPGNTVAVVTLRAWTDARLPADPPIQTTPLIISAGARRDYTLSLLLGAGITEGETFTLTYETLSANVFVQYTSFDATGRNQASSSKRDGMATMASLGTGEKAAFAGLIDPTRATNTQPEILSLFNPFANSAISLGYAVEAKFSDGTSIDLGSGSFTSNARIDITITGNSQLIAKANSGQAFRSYTILVRGTATQGSSQLSIAPFATLARTDTTTGATYLVGPALIDTRTSFNNAIFTAGGSLP